MFRFHSCPRVCSLVGIMWIGCRSASTTTSALLLNSQTLRRPGTANTGRKYSASPTLLQWKGLRMTTTSTTTRTKEHAGAGEENQVSNPTDQEEEKPPIEKVVVPNIGNEVPLYLNEGLFAVQKPLDWTSQDVVAFIRRMLERHAKERGAPDNRTKRRKPWMKVGHGGTLDPLATGVLVIGVGKGTKELQQYLVGTKGYRAGGQLGFQTTTLDMDPTGHIVDEKPFEHVTLEGMEAVLPQFRGTIEQVPPIFSALKKDGKRLYELGREGMDEQDVHIEPRQVVIYNLDLLPTNDKGEGLPACFGLNVECGGGTYIRSLIRDVGLSLDTVATMTSLERTKQGVFLTEHCLNQEDWTPDNISDAIEKCKVLLATSSFDDATQV